jgi:hypothetical protein
MEKVALGEIFSQYLGFPCKFSFHRVLHIYHHLSSGAGTTGQIMADVPRGLSLTPQNYSVVPVLRKKCPDAGGGRVSLMFVTTLQIIKEKDINL